MRLDEIERFAKKTYELIQRTVSIEKVEKIGEVDILEEISRIETERRPINALRVLKEIEERAESFGSDFHTSIRDEIERIVDDIRKERGLTKEIIERIKIMQEKLRTKEEEREELKEIFPVFDVLIEYFQNTEEIQETSRRIIQELRERDLLSKESFLKEGLKKEVKRVIRENIIRSFKSVEKLDEIVGRIFRRLEEEYG